MRAALVVGIVALAGVAEAQTSSHEAAATAAYDRGDLATALREFEAAYAETSRPDLLYVIGKLHAARGDCARAVEHFERFLATKPGPNARKGARAEIAKCQRAAATERDVNGEPAEPPTPAAPPPDPAAGDAVGPAPEVERPAPAPVRPRGSRAHAILIGSGVALDVAALLVYREARGTQCARVCTGITYDEYRDREDRASGFRTTAVILGAAGTAIIGVGVWRYVAHRRARAVDVAVVPGAGGGALVVGGRF